MSLGNNKEALLSVRNLNVRFHTRNGVVHAVNSLSFDLNKGEALGIVGESGSGKSVSCYSIMGLLPQPPGKIESGEAWLGGVDLLKASARQLQSIRGKRIGMIFQDPMTSLNPYLRISTQLIEPLLIHERIPKKEARKRAIQALEEVGIHDASKRIDYYPHEFSGGMRQRVMIAMELISEPEMLAWLKNTVGWGESVDESSAQAGPPEQDRHARRALQPAVLSAASFAQADARICVLSGAIRHPARHSASPAAVVLTRLAAI